MAVLVRDDPTVPAYIGLLTQPQGDQPSTGLTAGATAIGRYMDSCYQLLAAGATVIDKYTDRCYYLLIGGTTVIGRCTDRCFQLMTAAATVQI